MGWILNEGPKWLILTVWLLLNIGLFAVKYIEYANGDEYYYLRLMIGDYLAVARSTGFLLNFNCMLILLPVCRNVISFVRGYVPSRRARGQLDKNIFYHKYFAYMICFLSGIHCVAHLFNAQYFVASNQDTSGVVNALCNLDDEEFGQLNPFDRDDSNSILCVLKTIAGPTGIVLTLALVWMVTSATETIRRSYFELFWFTHHLFVVFFIALLLHGIQGVVRSQENIDEHPISKCAKNVSLWTNNVTEPFQCPLPRFKKTPAASWKWVLFPVLLYFIERCIRLYRSIQPVVITKVVQHPSRVLQIQMRKKSFKADVGQYVFLQCPSISHLEWHPFTLTSAPEDDYFGVHVRIEGDWTTALADKYGSPSIDPYNLPRMAVDGPFGTASEDVFDYEVDMLIGAGIGVTPFASVLRSLWHKQQTTGAAVAHHHQVTKKVYFYWICREMQAFEWFSDLLADVETATNRPGEPPFLDYNIYLTRGWTNTDAKHIFSNKDDDRDIMTGLTKKTNYGRPDFDQIFKTVAENHPGSRVGVFFCGPKVLSTQLHKLCNRHSNAGGNGVQFSYNKENF